MNCKRFDVWNEKKKAIHRDAKRPHFFVGEIWWALIGQNIGTEAIGKGEDYLRPVLIVQRVYGDACLAIPLSSRHRRGDYYFSFQDKSGHSQCALLPQIRYLDGKRLKYKQSRVKKSSLEQLREKLVALLKK